MHFVFQLHFSVKFVYEIHLGRARFYTHRLFYFIRQKETDFQTTSFETLLPLKVNAQFVPK